MRKQSTRLKIITTALQLLEEGGYETFTAQNLIEKAEISKGTLYHHFSSLDEVTLETLKWLKSKKKILPLLQIPESLSFSDFLENYFEYYLEERANNKFLTVLFYYRQRCLADKNYRQIKNSIISEFYQDFADQIQFFYPKQIPEEKLTKIVSLILFTLESVCFYSSLSDSKRNFRPERDFLLKMIVSDLENYS